MNNRLILVEGIPGSGKTTMSKKIKSYLDSKGKKVKLFNEGDPHPADMAWMSYLTLSEYQQLLNDHPNYKDLISINSLVYDDYVLVAHTKLNMSSREHAFIKYLEDHEIYDGKVPLEIFKKLHINRWKEFASAIDDETIVIFECAFIQNHINELLAHFNKDFDYIYDYLLTLIQTVEKLNPKLFYLNHLSVTETIQRVAKERVTNDKSKWEDWIDLVIRYIENSFYGKSYSLKGFDGVISYMETRKDLELKIIDHLPIDKVIVENSNFDWNEIEGKVLENLGI